jgi:hypothetical protein
MKKIIGREIVMRLCRKPPCSCAIVRFGAVVAPPQLFTVETLERASPFRIAV